MLLLGEHQSYFLRREFSPERSLYGGLEACSVEQSSASGREEAGKERGRTGVEHCALIDVSNPGRIVPAEINGSRVKKQNTCLC